jgi:hypothetical protein
MSVRRVAMKPYVSHALRVAINVLERLGKNPLAVSQLTTKKILESEGPNNKSMM